MTHWAAVWSTRITPVPLLLTGVRHHRRQGGPTRSSADVSVPRPRTQDDRTGRVFPDHLITYYGDTRNLPTLVPYMSVYFL